MSMHVNSSTDYLNTRPNVGFLGDKGSRLCFAVIILGALSFSLFVSVLVLAARPREVNVEVERVKVPICRDKFCRESSSEISKIMLSDVDPCDDFYQYVCGNFSNAYPVSQNVQMVSTYTLMQSRLIAKLASILESWKTTTLEDARPHPHDVAAFFYQSCVANASNDDIETAYKWMYLFGGWPLLGANVEDDQSQVKDIIDINTLALVLLDLQILFDVTVIPDFLKKESFILMLRKSPGSSLRPYSNPFPDINYAANQGFLNERIKFVAGWLDPNSKNLETLDQDINEIVAIETQIENINTTSSAYMLPAYSNPTFGSPDDIRKMKVTLSKLDEQVPLLEKISWVDVVKSILIYNSSNIEPLKFNVTKSFEVIADVDTLKQMASILRDSTPRTVHNWLVWKVLERQLPKISQSIRLEIAKTSGLEVTDSERCAEEVNYLMPYVAVDMYDEYYWKSEPGKKELVLSIVDQLKTQIKDIFEKSDWLDVDAKKELKSKVDSITSFVGFPDWIKDPKQLAAYYPIEKEEMQSLYDLDVELNFHKFVRSRLTLNGKFVRNEYWINPVLLVVNAWYHPLVNSLTIPIGYLDFPFLASTEQPRSVVFGNLAHTIAHEIFHAFDPSGIYFDGEGQLSKFLFDGNTAAKYAERLECLVNQYNQGANGKQTITEDFPDNAAMQVIFKAYKNTSLLYDDLLPDLELSKAKQLFVSYASSYCYSATPLVDDFLSKDVHSPNKFRVRVPLGNSDEFAKVFQCPSGSKMNPSSKCRIF